jgi:hypothetical protein
MLQIVGLLFGVIKLDRIGTYTWLVRPGDLQVPE